MDPEVITGHEALREEALNQVRTKEDYENLFVGKFDLTSDRHLEYQRALLATGTE